MAVSHVLIFFLDFLSVLLIIVDMSNSSSDYRAAYEAAKKELADLLANETKLEKRKLELRKTIESLGSLCESEEIDLDLSAEADYLLKNTSVADEIRSILRADWSQAFRPREVVQELENIGRDVALFQNPQSTVHMILKRLVESREADELIDDNGKKTYRWRHPLRSVVEKSRRVAVNPGASRRLETWLPEKKK